MPNISNDIIQPTQDDVPDGTAARQYTAAEKTKLAKLANIGIWVLNAAEARPAGVQVGDLIFRRP